MTVVVLDANAVIAHGRSFPNRVQRAIERNRTLVLPQSVKHELVDDVLTKEDAPENHRRSARSIQQVIDEGYLRVREPDYQRYGDVIDDARRRIADDSLPEHEVEADQYIPALVSELTEDDSVVLVTADGKLADVVRDVVERRETAHDFSIRSPGSVL